jgi:hypothetical protein
MYDIFETITSSMSEMAAADEPDPRALADLFGRTFAIMIPVQLVVMGCTFYCFYVTAKTIKSVELHVRPPFLTSLSSLCSCGFSLSVFGSFSPGSIKWLTAAASSRVRNFL